MTSPRILHIADDEKFINGANYLFDRAFPGSNTFVIIMPPRKREPRYVDPKPNFIFEPKSPKIIQKLLTLSAAYDVVILHKVDRLKGALLLQSDEPEKFMGIIFGAEVFNSNIMGDDYLGEKTRKLAEGIREKTIMGYAKEFYGKIRYRKIHDLYRDVSIEEVLNRLSCFGSVTENAYDDYYKKGILRSKKTLIPFTYYPLEFIIKDPELRANGPHILLGNSASATNNPVEAIDRLSESDLKDRKVFVPLCYGDRRYAKEIIKYGRDRLGKNFKPLLKFMPLEEYNRVISRCGVVIMNHQRSQAFGNVIASLYMGARVYLNDTDLYRYFTGLGCHVYLIENESMDLNKFLTQLEPEKIEENRIIIEQGLSTEELTKRIKAKIYNPI